MPGYIFPKLEKLTFDRAHSCHEAIELGEKALLIVPGSFDLIGGRTVAYPLKGIGQLHVQKPHALLQIQELLV